MGPGKSEAGARSEKLRNSSLIKILQNQPFELKDLAGISA